MSTQEHDEMRDLLGAYALDALDAVDRARVDSYLERSPAARTEVDELRETAAMLALTPAPSERAPREIWDRIAHDIRTRAGAGAARAPAPATDLATRRSVAWKFVAPAAAAAAIIVALLAYQVVDLRSRADDVAVPTAAQFERAAGVPGAREVALAGGGTTRARVVVLPDGTGYLVNDRLAPLDARRTYQLWALVGNARRPTAISAGVLGNDPRAAAFKVSAPVVGFAVTEEQAGGVPTSKHRPVAVGTLPA